MRSTAAEEKGKCNCDFFEGVLGGEDAVETETDWGYALPLHIEEWLSLFCDDNCCLHEWFEGKGVAKLG